MEISYEEANQLMGEIVRLFEERGVNVSLLDSQSLDDIVDLIYQRGGHAWDSHNQEWKAEWDFQSIEED